MFFFLRCLQRWTVAVCLLGLSMGAQALTMAQARAMAEGDTDARLQVLNQALLQADAATAAFFPGGQRLLRNRISAATYELVNDNNDNTYDHGSFFSYDDHGNVNYLVQSKTNGFTSSAEYEYDIISGNVNKIVYNRGKMDQF
jgi:hypothetical protein